MVGADRILCDSPAEDGRPAVVSGDWRDRRRGTYDQVHDGLLPGWGCGRFAADAGTVLFYEQVVLGRDRTGGRDLPAESGVAGAARFYFAAFSLAYSQAGCGPGAGGGIFVPAVSDLHESVFDAAVDRRADLFFSRAAIPDA